jgi:ssDNA thymidine ADP-ribosyltransferase DarT-like protein
MSEKLNPTKALIFRITHRTNVPWIFEHGMFCRSSSNQDPNYRTIGNPELIYKRASRDVPIHPFGTLSDYIPFYFTPFTPMMNNIKTGWGGITKVPNEDVVIFVSSIHHLAGQARTFVFTDRHAYLVGAEFYSNVKRLDQIDWQILQNRDFRRDPDDPGKFERYQAEALVYDHMPLEAFFGVVCYTDQVKAQLFQLATGSGVKMNIITETRWYI